MIKHIVMWRLKAENRQIHAEQLRQQLEKLREIIPEIRHLEVGINFDTSEQASDVVLYSEFETLEDMLTYQRHSEHQKVVQFLNEVRTEKRVADYEI